MLNRERNFCSFWIVLCIATVLIFMIIPPASSTDFPGPDEFGYVAFETGSDFREIGTTGNPVNLGDDQVSGAIPIRFTFSFYGVPYTDVYISSNGFITFDPTEDHGWSGGDSVPNTGSPNNIIAGYWEDLHPSAPNSGSVSIATIGTEGNREFVVEFKDVHHFDVGFPVTFQIILHEGSNDIELQYGSAQSDGGTHTVGIENADGTTGMQIVYGNISIENKGFIITKNSIFENFEVQRAIVSFGRGSALDHYDFEGEFSLPESTNGTINPVDEDVLITVGSSKLVIPAGSFKVKRRKKGADFRGWVEGAHVQASLKTVGPDTFRYKFDVREVDLTDSAVPINFKLRVGISLGLTTIPLYGELSTGRSHNYKARKTPR